MRFPGNDVDLTKVLHGSQSITLHRPISTGGTAAGHPRITDVWDREKAAVIVQEATITEETGAPLWTTGSTIHARDDGGFGERCPSMKPRPTPDRDPLHADPEFAARAGFPRPILHGLCTWGMVAKAIVDAVLGGDVSRVRSYSATFFGVVYPGETLRTRIWSDAGRHTATVLVVERDAPVLVDGSLLTVE